MARSPKPAWRTELDTALAHHRPTLGWLPGHVATLMPQQIPLAHLIAMTSDLCDAGHVHLDVILWVLHEGELCAVLVGEEHYDRGPEDVETTFETTLNRHPIDTIAGVQLATAAHPDGHQIDVSLAVMLGGAGQTGHADPVDSGDPDMPGFSLHTQPSSLTFSADPDRTDELVAFADALVATRELAIFGG